MYTITEIQKIIIHCDSLSELQIIQLKLRYLSQTFRRWSEEEVSKIEAAYLLRKRVIISSIKNKSNLD